MIIIKNLIKKFNEKTIINDLNLNIEKKIKITVFAPSGAGKTTLINILSELDKDYSGSIKINTDSMSTIFQEPRLFYYMTVKENILLPYKLKKIQIDSKELKLYEEWLDICNLKKFESYYPYQISGGMKQKVSTIRGFLLNPQLILMDEPFKSIDIKAKITITDFIKAKYKNSTIFFVTHSLDEIPLLSDKIIVFKENILEKYQEIKLNEDYDLQQIYDKIKK